LHHNYESIINVLQDRILIDFLTEMQTGVDNMSIMAMQLCHAMGIDVPSLLRTLEEESELEFMSDVGEEV
jgi:hypothetical protein